MYSPAEPQLAVWLFQKKLSGDAFHGAWRAPGRQQLLARNAKRDGLRF
jgi:hypothetical protein